MTFICLNGQPHHVDGSTRYEKHVVIFEEYTCLVVVMRL